MQYILSIDQSTSGTKALLIDHEGKIISKLVKNHAQYYPHKDWIEHDANEIWRNTTALIFRTIFDNNLSSEDISSITITNQRETTVLWDRETGEPVYNAVVWQCQRGTQICRELKEYGEMVKEKTGMALSPYYPAAKLSWMLENIAGLRERAENGEICFGTIDSYLIYRLTGQKEHATDISNASRTQLFNIRTLQWDEELLGIFKIPKQILPQVLPSDGDFGYTDESTGIGGIPISAVMGDSHAALFGHQCLERGMAKVTFGTGSSIMCNIGEKYMKAPKGISLSIAWEFDDKVNYVFEGNVTCSGDTLNWLINEMQLVRDVDEIEQLAGSVDSAGGVYLVPAFSGLGAPYFVNGVKGVIVGLGRSSSKVQIVRAAIESLVYQTVDVMEAIQKKCGVLKLYASGGPTVNKVMMQLLADYLGQDVYATEEKELSGLGVAYMGGLKTGYFNALPKDDSNFIFQVKDNPYKEAALIGWKKAVQKVLNFN
ncbi:MAG TPA: glycerol kinase GlpK [Clostridiales bacterium]|nr:glycerol kinase GlpK [Clostridiales bacterium]